MKLGEENAEYVVAELSQYNLVLVTGPQRSGTTITAKMLADDLGYDFVNEFDDRFRNNYDNLVRLAESGDKCVVQAPVMCHSVQRLSHSGVAVVMMIRDRESIIKSQDRINWSSQHEPTEVQSYKDKWKTTDGRICDMKYEVWEKQKKVMKVPYYEMQYECQYMTSHGLYREKSKRTNFGPKQTA